MIAGVNARLGAQTYLTTVCIGLEDGNGLACLGHLFIIYIINHTQCIMLRFDPMSPMTFVQRPRFSSHRRPRQRRERNPRLKSCRPSPTHSQRPSTLSATCGHCSVAQPIEPMRTINWIGDRVMSLHDYRSDGSRSPTRG